MFYPKPSQQFPITVKFISHWDKRYIGESQLISLSFIQFMKKKKRYNFFLEVVPSWWWFCPPRTLGNVWRHLVVKIWWGWGRPLVSSRKWPGVPCSRAVAHSKESTILRADGEKPSFYLIYRIVMRLIWNKLCGYLM